MKGSTCCTDVWRLSFHWMTENFSSDICDIIIGISPYLLYKVLQCYHLKVCLFIWTQVCKGWLRGFLRGTGCFTEVLIWCICISIRRSHGKTLTILASSTGRSMRMPEHSRVLRRPDLDKLPESGFKSLVVSFWSLLDTGSLAFGCQQYKDITILLFYCYKLISSFPLLNNDAFFD